MNGQRGQTLYRCLAAGLLVIGGVVFTSSLALAHGLGPHVAGGQGENGHRQVGFSWDTSVAESRPFNYRMNLGYEWFELEDNWGYKEKFSGWILENTFGYRLMANEKLRLWTGPQIVTGLYESDLGIGLGLSMGVNLHVGERSSLGMTAGWRRSEYSGIWGGADHESVGYLRFDYFFRTPRDRFVGQN